MSSSNNDNNERQVLQTFVTSSFNNYGKYKIQKKKI